MLYRSLNNLAPEVSFKEAVVKGLAPDKGLYFPTYIPELPESFFQNIESFSKIEIGTKLLKYFTGEDIPDQELEEIISKTIDFPFPLIEISPDVYTLELFHGPTLAFKDVGARFMAGCLSFFNSDLKEQNNTILVATSGDTGGAVANGFYKKPGIKVVILYPSGKVSELQEKQLTTLGNNISAIEIDGTFDDCQAIVKKAFLDESLLSLKLTSANSINVARWLPQMLYYFYTYQELKKYNKPLVISVPSGNFGNIGAAVVAQKMGLPIKKLIASTNSNDTVPRFYKDGIYEPTSTKQTISNAMDVSNPSNFVRIMELFEGIDNSKKYFSSYSFTEAETEASLRELWEKCNYLADPHGAVGYLGLKKEMSQHQDSIGIFLETAHPVKFSPAIEKVLKCSPEIPASTHHLFELPKKSFKMKEYDEVKTFLQHLW
ncbi:MAG: threonine synthase [Flavobacterium sp.]